MNHNIELSVYSYLIEKRSPINFKKNEAEIIFQIARELLLSGVILKSSVLSKKNLDLKDKLTKLNRIYILKNLLNSSILDIIKTKFLENGICFFLLKGSAFEKYNIFQNNERHHRDIDILVHFKDLNNSYKLLNEMGFKYYNKDSADCTKYLYNKHHLPPMVNKDGVVIELHHRVTKKRYLNECFLTDNIFNNSVEINGFFVPNRKDLIVHAAYHGLIHHTPTPLPNFLYDIFMVLKKDPKILYGAKKDFSMLGLDEEFLLIEEIFKKSFSDNLNERQLLSIIDKLGISITKNYTKSNGNIISFEKKKERLSLNKLLNYLINLSYYYQISFFSIDFAKLFLVKICEKINSGHGSK